MIEPKTDDCKRCRGSGTIAIGKQRDTHLLCGCPAGLASSLFVPHVRIEAYRG